MLYVLWHLYTSGGLWPLYPISYFVSTSLLHKDRYDLSSSPSYLLVFFSSEEFFLAERATLRVFTFTEFPTTAIEAISTQSDTFFTPPTSENLHHKLFSLM